MAWEIIQNKGDLLPWHDWLWNGTLSKRVSLCIWKAWFNGLSVDGRVQKKGVSLASACDCCSQKNQETIDHVLSLSQLAEERRRCKARMEGVKDSIEQVSRTVRFWIKALTDRINYSRPLSQQGLLLLDEFRLDRPAMSTRKEKLVNWLKPPRGWIKLNCEGSCRGNPRSSGGGGIIRDDRGNFKGAFVCHFGFGTSNGASLKAFLGGVKLCKRLRYADIIIESDSKVVVEWFRSRRCSLWYLWDFWDELISEMEGLNITVIHQFREANQAANFLAK
ncbi:uncharacterized protein LOC121242162 [Juglans microcarpa x Juglans regia]|uniref:uncharacterized protein LOC121242162 n=1 Tax=Juglans microcarpa x Juglans regia TaxID=2249226 RepID=UPI001B7ED52B|nr:uncharacterized protein LOC121242162 [Juglans microcarpa x Juglans regia]